MTQLMSDDVVLGLGSQHSTGADPAAAPLVKLTIEQAVRLRAAEWFLGIGDKTREATAVLADATVVADYILSGKMPERQSSATGDNVTTLVRK